MIRGEYWFYNGDVWFADGDIGDYNHSGYAIDHARRCLLSSLGAQEVDEPHDQAFEKSLTDLFEDEEIDVENLTLLECYLEYCRQKRLEPDALLWNVCYDLGTDVREYAMKHWGWKWVKGMWAATHTLTRSDFKEIAEGFLEAADQEGEEMDPDIEVEIAVVSTGRRYDVAWKDLENDNYEVLGIAVTTANPKACDQVRKMDQQLMLPCYGGQFGD